MIFEYFMLILANIMCLTIFFGVRKKGSFIYEEFVVGLTCEMIMQSEKEYKSIYGIKQRYDKEQLEKKLNFYQRYITTVISIMWVFMNGFTVLSLMGVIE